MASLTERIIASILELGRGANETIDFIFKGDGGTANPGFRRLLGSNELFMRSNGRTDFRRIEPKAVAVASNTVLTSSDHNSVLLVVTSAARQITLPTAAAGLMFHIKDASGAGASVNNITIARAGSESIDGIAANLVLKNDRISRTLVCDGTNWFSLSSAILQPTDDANMILNLSLVASVASNALTIAVKGKDGTDPSPSNPVYIAFRGSTQTIGDYVVRTITAALSITVPSGATLGHANGVSYPIFVYAIDNGGTVELAVSTTISNENALRNTTAISGGSATSGLYSSTARTGVATRAIGKLTSTQTTAGTWAAAPTSASVIFPRDNPAVALQARQISSLPDATYIGETVTTDVTSATTVTANTYVDAGGTLTLNPGNWIIYLNINAGALYTSGAPVVQLAIRDSSNNIIHRINWSPALSAAAVGANMQFTQCVPVNINTATTYKLSIRCNANNTVAAASINAANSAPSAAFDTDSFWYAKRSS